MKAEVRFKENEKLAYEAMKFVKWEAISHIDIDDMRQSALMHLYEACQKYDEDNSTIEFSTYAIYHIKQRLWQELGHTRRHNADCLNRVDNGGEEGKSIFNALQDQKIKLDDVLFRKDINDIIEKINKKKRNKRAFDFLSDYVKGYSQQEIADKHGITHQYVSNEIRRYRGLLAQYA